MLRLAAALLVSSSLAFALVACGGSDAASPPPLIPEATAPEVNQPSTRPVSATRSMESKTLGADSHSATTGSTLARPASPTQTPPTGAWAPTPVNGNMNPSPPSGTPVNGEMNPSPPGK